MKIANTELANKLFEENVINKNFKYEYILDQIDIGRTTEDENEELTEAEIQELLETIKYNFINELEAKDNKRLCESKSVNSNFRTSMISIILRRMPSLGIRPY